MKRLFGLVLVLCVVASTSFAAQLDEYSWTGTTGNFSDSTWKVVVAGTTVYTEPPVPFESMNTTDYTAYARPSLTTDASKVTLTSDFSNVGFAQMAVDKGSLIIDAGGKLLMNSGYLSCGAKNTIDGNRGLIIQNGGQYISHVADTDNQKGTLINYTTANSKGGIAISGAGSSFTSDFVYAARRGYTTQCTAFFDVLGSGSTISIGKMAPGSTKVVTTFGFTTDASGVSAIDIANSIDFGSTTTAYSKLNLVLGAEAAPQIVLFDLAAGATRTGYLSNAYGRQLLDGNMFAAAGGEALYRINYFAGETGNDVVLTLVPEPATLGLLSLGGLLLARRRRA